MFHETKLDEQDIRHRKRLLQFDEAEEECFTSIKDIAER